MNRRMSHALAMLVPPAWEEDPELDPTVRDFYRYLGCLAEPWDGLAVPFLMFWLIGLMTELQRAEALSLDKFLHLPVSLQGVFLINYLSSLVSFTMLFFLPAALALCLALVFAKGPVMLVLFPL